MLSVIRHLLVYPFIHACWCSIQLLKTADMNGTAHLVVGVIQIN